MLTRIFTTLALATTIALLTAACQGQTTSEQTVTQQSPPASTTSAAPIPTPRPTSAIPIPARTPIPTAPAVQHTAPRPTATRIGPTQPATPTPQPSPTVTNIELPETSKPIADSHTNYLTKDIPPCTPITGSTVTPCEPSIQIAAGITQSMGSGADPAQSPQTMRELLDGSSMLSVGHIVARATYIPDTVRCERDVPFHVPSYESPGYFEFSLLMQCYVDIRVNSYILGNGPPNLTIQVFHYHYQGNTHGQADYTHDESIDLMLWVNEMILETGDPLLPPEIATTGLYGREEILFLGPSMNHATEALQKFYTWDVQTKADGTVIAVHPARDYWHRRRPNDYQAHLASLEMELPAFSQALAAAHQERVADYGGRILSANYDGKPEGATFPMLITDANRLSQFYRDTGAYDHPGGPPTLPTPVPSCARGEAVANTAANRPLRRDCTALLDAKDTLAGTATLNWSKDLAIASWTGVSKGGTPERITEVNMASSSLSGTIPEGIAKLDALTSLDLSSNSLTGEIPGSLENLKALTTLKLSGNSLTGCIPPALRDIATHDLDDLELPDCQPPTEAASCAGSTAVGTDPGQGLVDDCNTLLDSKDTLAGTDAHRQETNATVTITFTE